MSVESAKENARRKWAEKVAYRLFRSKNGTKLFRAEHMTIDDSYAQHYNFIIVIYRLRNVDKQYTVTVNESAFQYEWEEVK